MGRPTRSQLPCAFEICAVAIVFKQPAQEPATGENSLALYIVGYRESKQCRLMVERGLF